VYLLVDGQFPTTTLDDTETTEESLLQAAQRAATAASSKTTPLELYSPSQAPVAVHMTKDKDENDERYFGTKTFFLKLQYDDGSIQGGGESWLDRSEIVALHKDQEDQAKFYQYLL
jgi:hypothetical protein